ncbi:MAG: hypothetical protein KDA79_17665 [Planctomycetaceae bacterium]|nr:hypothetical protein [Planctomycetaceae bacterium]
MQGNKMGVEGLERNRASAILGNGLRVSQSAGAAECDALSAKTTPLPAELARLVAAWADLPEAVRQTITGLVELHRPPAVPSV